MGKSQIPLKSPYDFEITSLYKQGMDETISIKGKAVLLNNLNIKKRIENDPTIEAIWCPQGGSVEIPVVSTGANYVFTPDFTGCSLLVDQIKDDTYKVYHVEGGKFHFQYLNKDHGIGFAGGLGDGDYFKNAGDGAFAFVRYEDQRWWIYYQKKSGLGIGDKKGQFVVQGLNSIAGGGKIPIGNLTRERNVRIPKIGNILWSSLISPDNFNKFRNLIVPQRDIPNPEFWDCNATINMSEDKCNIF